MERVKLLRRLDVVPDNVISRIRKLLALATKGNTTEAEAELSMKKAQELLSAWNISVASIDQTDTSIPDEKRVKEEHSRSANYKYQQTLWSSIAHVNFCLHWSIPVYKEYQIPDPEDWYNEGEDRRKIWISRAVSKRHYFVGRESNVLATKLMGDYLEETINKLCPYKGNSNASISWKTGCTSRLASRLFTRMRDLKKENEQTVTAEQGALMLLKDVYSVEYDKNMDAEFGEGFSAEKRKAQQEKKAKFEKNDKIISDPKSYTASEYQEAVKYFAQIKRNEESRSRSNSNDSSEINTRAWYEGRKAGDLVGLDLQVGSKNSQQLKLTGEV